MSAVSTARISSVRLSQIRQRLIWLAALGAIVGATSYKLGVLAGLLALAGALAVPLLLNSPRVAFALWLIPFVIAESEPQWNVGVFHKLYAKTPLFFSVNFLLLLLAAAAVLLDVARAHVEPRLPKPFGPALALVLLAIIFGFASGALGPGIPRYQVLGAVEVYGLLLLPPLLMINIVRTRRDLERLLLLLALLAVFKAVLGIIGLLAGITVPEVGTSRLSYIEPMPNWMLTVYLLVVAAAAFSRTRLPRWMWWFAPVVLAAFMLGQRRSFWLGAGFALILVVLIATGRTGRRLLIPTIGVAALVIYISVATGVVGPVQGELVRRAVSVAPAKVTANKEDRYRLAELRNIVPAIEQQPFSGLGIGVPWREISPLPFEFESNHTYAHVAILYWWMTCGLIGALAYLVLIFSAVVTGVRLWWRRRDPLLQVVALAIGLGWITMAIVELTTTVIGSNRRGTALMAVSLGVLAVIYRGFGEERSRAPSRASASNPTRTGLPPG